MDKKVLLIGGAAVAVAGAYLLTRDKSASDIIDNVEKTLAGKTGRDAQDSMSATVMSAEDTAYNLARQQFYSAAGKYPPESWTIEQIQEAVGNWTKIRQNLTSYTQYMGKMDKLAEAKKNAENCYDLATAERLATGAKEDYEVYQKKQTIYNNVVNICNKYGISAADLGVANFATASITSLQNAETKANQLGSLKSRYDELSRMCVASNQPITKYIGNTKWYNVLMATYDSAIANIRTIYTSMIQSMATENVKALWRNLNPYRYGMDGNINLMSFRDRPYEDKWALDPGLFQSAVDFCAQSSDHLAAWKAAFKAEHQDCPTYRCQAKSNWPYFDTLAGLMVSCIAHSGGSTHLTGRDNWGEVEKIYKTKKAPLV